MVQQWYQERAGTTITLLSTNVGRMRQPVHDCRNVACSSSSQHRCSHRRPCRQQLGRPWDAPYHLLNHATRHRRICRDGCPAHWACVRSLGRSDEAVPVHDVPTWLRPWVSTKPADGLRVHLSHKITHLPPVENFPTAIGLSIVLSPLARRRLPTRYGPLWPLTFSPKSLPPDSQPARPRLARSYSFSPRVLESACALLSMWLIVVPLPGRKVYL
jgi:hypothetical protein